MTTLVIAAHPDDEVLGCGGTVARLANGGERVILAILGEGMTSRYQDQHETPPELLGGLRQAAGKAAEVLGASDVQLSQLPDNRFDSLPLLDIVKVVERLIQEVGPDTIYTHHAGDLNIDHRVTHQAVLTATRPQPGERVRDVYSFEVASSTEWAFTGAQRFEPNVFVDITATLDRKAKALSCYETELRDFPHPRSEEGVRVIARHWGTVVGLEAAEAFQLVRSVR